MYKSLYIPADMIDPEQIIALMVKHNKKHVQFYHILEDDALLHLVIGLVKRSDDADDFIQSIIDTFSHHVFSQDLEAFVISVHDGEEKQIFVERNNQQGSIMITIETPTSKYVIADYMITPFSFHTFGTFQGCA